mmetsp:Transcript_8358/g.18245  ORF Transcript_8358/g.18245 Transcript_8358/m.18245 type:complete len:133 (-) Transcript_8358:2184-2582(-)
MTSEGSDKKLNAMGRPFLVPQHPVPSDIDVSKSIVAAGVLPDIRTVAAEAGILESELIPWGNHKAKVSLSVRERLKVRPPFRKSTTRRPDPPPTAPGRPRRDASISRTARTGRPRRQLRGVHRHQPDPPGRG